MRSVCLYFQVHQPFRLRTYRFFDIGDNHYYYDDYHNGQIMRRIAERSYLPMNQLFLKLIQKYGKSFRLAFSISGSALDQFEMFAPEVLKSFQALAKTGNVEFLAETNAHSLASLRSKEEFERQVLIQKERIEKYFGKSPTAFRNTELIYSDGIGEMIANLGFKVILTEGARHLLGWKSPNLMYCNNINPKLKVLLRNYRLSDDIAFRFSNQGWSEWPLTTDKFVEWLNALDQKQEVVNIFMDYETFGEHQWKETGIFDFMEALPQAVFNQSDFEFHTPSELADMLQPVAVLNSPWPVSWADEERDLTAWLGNDLQDEAVNNLYKLVEKVAQCNDASIQKDWNYLQNSDHFYYMCTKWFSDGEVHKYFNPYSSPYEAFINYMNVLSDFIIRVDKCLAANPAKPAEESTTNPNEASFFGKAEDLVEEIATELKKSARQTSKKIKEAVNEMKEKKYTLDDLKDLSAAKLKKTIKDMDAENLVHALKDAGDELTEKILPQLSADMRKEYELIKTEIRKISKNDVKKARKKIEDELKRIFS